MAIKLKTVLLETLKRKFSLICQHPQEIIYMSKMHLQ